MGNGHSSKDAQVRHQIAVEAARIMMEQAVADHYAAKRKAVERLGLAGNRNLPSNIEVQQALRDRQLLYEGNVHTRRLRSLREIALAMMRLLRDFHPHLVGPVLEGVAGEHAAVHLHLFADTPDELAAYLDRQRIPFMITERRLRYPRDRRESHPLFRFLTASVAVELTVFPPPALARPPLSPVDGRAMARAGISAVERLLAEGEPGR
jgi:hypothetical protein